MKPNTKTATLQTIVNAINHAYIANGRPAKWHLTETHIILAKAYYAVWITLQLLTR